MTPCTHNAADQVCESDLGCGTFWCAECGALCWETFGAGEPDLLTCDIERFRDVNWPWPESNGARVKNANGAPPDGPWWKLPRRRA